MRTLALAALLLLGASAAFAAPPKQPWELSLDEHLALRAKLGKLAPQNTMFSSDHRPVTVIDGNANAGAFMPIELLRELVNSAYQLPAEGRRTFRQHYNQTLVALGLGAEFWSKLAPIVEPMAKIQRPARNRTPEEQAAALAEPPNTTFGPTAYCKATAEALNSAYNAFGRQRFDQFLYQGVAPGTGLSEDPVDRKTLLWVQGGCQ